VITAWKRVYVEYDAMFRRGAFINRPAAAGTSCVFLSDLSPFQTGDIVRFVHAPPRTSIAVPQATPNNAGLVPHREDHRISVKSLLSIENGQLTPPHLELVQPDGTPAKLIHSYGPDPSYPQTTYLSDAAGVVSSISTTLPLNDSLILGAFSDSFVDVVTLANSNNAIPHLARFPAGAIGHFPFKWADASINRLAGLRVTSKPNHQYVITASRYYQDPLAPNGQPGALFGHTPVHLNGFSFSWIWWARIADAVSEPSQPVFGLSAAAAGRETVVHEITHQWHVNPMATAGTNVGHCLSERHQQDGHYCLMHMPFNSLLHNIEWADDEVALHYESAASATAANSEYFTIRHAPEPLPIP
jgi:hypothetical protein